MRRETGIGAHRRARRAVLAADARTGAFRPGGPAQFPIRSANVTSI
jgi:hypothetical protein